MTNSPPFIAQRVAIVGSGISGLAAAHALQGKASITLFEAADYFGGHTHTVDVTLPASEGGNFPAGPRTVERSSTAPACRSSTIKDWASPVITPPQFPLRNQAES